LAKKKRDSFSLKIVVLGSGSCVPSYKRYPASYFFYPFNLNENWLVDIGEGALFRLSEAGVSYREIDRIFVSHTHPDHIGALVPLLLALNYTPGFKRQKPLYIYGSDDVREYLQMHLDFAPYLRSNFPMEFIALLPDEGIKIENSLLKTKKMEHFNPTFGYRWNFGGYVVVYGGDGGFSDALIQLAYEADFLILESSYPEDKKISGHLTTKEAGKIARIARAKRLMLTHFYPEVANMNDKEIKNEVRSSGYEGEIIVAKDLMTIHV
jgi:ribonuclease BN (tRNA processing enzyme)